LGDTCRFGQVVLVAPDVDERWFAQVAPEVRDVATRVTLYASSGDKVLRTARAVHGHARAGGAHESWRAGAGVDAIDVTRLRSEMFGHGYLDELARDLRAVLRDGRAPAERPWLEASPDSSAGWWRLKR
jgi:esterase/lipase superfamily enzyme